MASTSNPTPAALEKEKEDHGHDMVQEEDYELAKQDGSQAKGEGNGRGNGNNDRKVEEGKPGTNHSNEEEKGHPQNPAVHEPDLSAFEDLNPINPGVSLTSHLIVVIYISKYNFHRAPTHSPPYPPAKVSLASVVPIPPTIPHLNSMTLNTQLLNPPLSTAPLRPPVTTSGHTSSS